MFCWAPHVSTWKRCFDFSQQLKPSLPSLAAQPSRCLSGSHLITIPRAPPHPKCFAKATWPASRCCVAIHVQGKRAVEPHNAAVVEIETTKIMETNLENPTWPLAPSWKQKRFKQMRLLYFWLPRSFPLNSKTKTWSGNRREYTDIVAVRTEHNNVTSVFKTIIPTTPLQKHFSLPITVRRTLEPSSSSPGKAKMDLDLFPSGARQSNYGSSDPARTSAASRRLHCPFSGLECSRLVQRHAVY